MNLVLDIGNTCIKIAAFEGDQLLAFNRLDSIDHNHISNLIADFPTPDSAIISSVGIDPADLAKVIGDEFPILFLDETTILPFINKYKSPETLGKDRLAGVAAAYRKFSRQDVLIIDAGTAITYDLLTASGEYLGGAISPGIRMRYKALHTFTSRLPLLDSLDTEDVELIGQTTAQSIHSGVLNGAASEVEGTILKYRMQYPALHIVLTGGDYNYFDKQLKVKTFAAPNLVLEGLNFILNYNLEKKKPT